MLLTPSGSYMVTGAGLTCPLCNGQAWRVKRRFVDQLSSLFAPCRRYKCHEFGCDWEGIAARSLSAQHA